ncbi:MAG: BrnA antitoxin family protein [Syntrophobacteraceae bacterium]|nr:BrnA antitoxin family protein [Syntrophobacteraceae bacterium]
MTQAEIDANVASVPDEEDMVVDWDNVTVEMPQPKAVLNMRVDKDVLEFFRRKGKGYQTAINAVLRAYMKAHEDRR